MATKYFIAPNAWGIFCGMDKTARIDSRTVAEAFEKRHDHVVRDIEKLKKSLENIKAENSALTENTDNSSKNIKTQNWGLTSSDNIDFLFVEKSYKAGTGKKYKCYEMNRKGFTLLTFGFTGEKALKFQTEYITRFDEMEELIRDKLAYLEDYPGFTDAIKYFKDSYSTSENEAKWIYANEQDVVNVAVLGMTAKAFKKRYGIPDNEKSIKPYLTGEQIKAIHKLQSYDVPFLVQGMPRDERIKQLTALAKTLKLHIGTDVQEAELKKQEEKSA